eukprot:TRINITY_DN88834_c0_g1_i1.p1 TRINITY_DN88834_c0_g1~~TRINITY_DN88834_c0_g1_i1.p1  ORF type:complete len:108 (-),score=0.79 TRINITY_DN88834_c0_g1_i1:291-614(-)
MAHLKAGCLVDKTKLIQLNDNALMFRIDLNTASLIGHTDPDVEAACVSAQCLRPKLQDQCIGCLTTFTGPCFELYFPLVVNVFLRIVALCLVHNHAIAPESLKIRVG